MREFLCLTPRAQSGLLGLLRRHEMQIEKFAWEAPADDLLWSHLYHWDIETRLEPVTQGRIVDVSAAFRALKPAADLHGSVTISVEDETAPWNRGVWRIEAEGGQVTVQATRETPQLSFDIQALSQAYFGTPTLEEIRAADRMQIVEERSFSLLKSVLGTRPMWTNDSF